MTMTIDKTAPRLSLAWLVIGVQLLAGAGCEFFELPLHGASALSPREGVLVIGRGDTLRGYYSTTWPLYLDGSYGITPYHVRARIRGNDLDPNWGFVASPSQHNGYLTPTETSEWKMWLSGSQPPSAGTYKLIIGGNGGNPNDDDPYIPSQALRVIVLEEGSLFIVEIVPAASVQQQGTTETRVVRLIRAQGFTAPVQLSLYQPPSGISAVFNPTSVSGDTSFMALTVGDSVALGTKNLTVVGTQGNITRVAFFTVDVVAAQYIVHLTPDTLRLTPGQNSQVTVSVTGSHLPVMLSAPNEPNVAPFTFSPNPTSSTSTMTISVDPLAQGGTRQITVTGTFSNGRTARDTLTLNIASSAQWRTVFFQNSVLLFGLGFENSSTGFGMAVTQSAAKSTDGGRSWSFVNPPPSQASDVAVVGPLRAVAVGGNNKIMRTYDGGLSWVERNSGLTSGSWLAIGFNPTDPNLGVAVGRYGVITRTTNGGDDWVAVSSENISSPHLYDVSLYGSTGTIVGTSSFGSNGSILRSTDSGLTWSPQTIGMTQPLNGVSFTNENQGIAVGNDGTILSTFNGGATWLTLSAPTQATLYDIVMLNSQQATAVGSGGTILQTSNGSQSWALQSVPLAAQSATLWKVFVFPDNSAVCLGNSTGCIILRRD